MKLIKTGATRYVFLLWKYAIKVPCWYSYKNFLLGLLANLQEHQWSKLKICNEKLCPVLFSLPGGFLNIMPRVQELNDEEFIKLNASEFIKYGDGFEIPCELKTNSFGRLKNKIVVIDYGGYKT